MLSPKLQTTIILALLFLVISSPYMYSLVNTSITQPVLNTRIVESGVPTRTGMVLHAVVFGLFAYFFALK